MESAYVHVIFVNVKMKGKHSIDNDVIYQSSVKDLAVHHSFPFLVTCGFLARYYEFVSGFPYPFLKAVLEADMDITFT